MSGATTEDASRRILMVRADSSLRPSGSGAIQREQRNIESSDAGRETTKPFVGLMIYLSVPVVWISAILHWALHFPREGPRVLWGLIVVFGFVPGAIVYWFRGVRHSARD
jgi:hypothetical protein